MRGFAPAMRVMSRSEPPAFASGSWPSTRVAPAWLTTTFASTCGTWLVSATSRRGRPASIATRERAELADEAVDEAVALRARSRRSASGTRSRPRRGRREACSAPCDLRAGDRVAADEARRAAGGGDDAGLRRADVGDGRLLAGGGEHRRDLRRRAPRSAPRRRRGRRRRPPPRAMPAASTAPRSTAGGECVGVGVPAGDVGARGARGQADRGADQPGADDGEPLRRPRQRRRISSASRNARSSDWRAFRRGSQSVS